MLGWACSLAALFALVAAEYAADHTSGTRAAAPAVYQALHLDPVGGGPGLGRVRLSPGPRR